MSELRENWKPKLAKVTAAERTGRMTDRRQIARQIWEAHKHWDGEKKFALRMIIKWLEEEKNVGTVVDTDVSGGS
jgi:hypothetical protein